MKPAVLIDQRIYDKGQATFGTAQHITWVVTQGSEEDLARRVRSEKSTAVVVSTDRFVGPLYQALAEQAGGGPALIARFGVGHDGIDKALARQHGIAVTITPHTLDQSVAELALAMMLGLARYVATGDAVVRAGQFSLPAGLELHGKHLVLIGAGGIARALARMARFGLGMRVSAVGRRTAEQLAASLNEPLPAYLARHGIDQYSHRLEELLPQADVVSLHIPSGPETRQLLNAQRLALLSPSAVLINTARGNVVDEQALYHVLAANRLRGAALDVFTHEPYMPVSTDCDLRTLPNVLLLPHVGSHTTEAAHRMAASCLETLTKFFAGELTTLPRVD